MSVAPRSGSMGPRASSSARPPGRGGPRQPGRFIASVTTFTLLDRGHALPILAGRFHLDQTVPAPPTEAAMDPTRFDSLTKRLARPGPSRRQLLRGLGSGLLASVLGRTVDAAPACRGAGHPCSGHQSCCAGLVCTASGRGAVPRCAAPVTPSPQTCANPTAPCDANPTTCGTNCTCVTTTSGGSACVTDEQVCLANASTCSVDSDCAAQFNSPNFVCVATTGCAGLNCGGNGNACAPLCQG
jgi:hypothetical protein